MTSEEKARCEERLSTQRGACHNGIHCCEPISYKIGLKFDVEIGVIDAIDDIDNLGDEVCLGVGLAWPCRGALWRLCLVDPTM